MLGLSLLAGASHGLAAPPASDPAAAASSASEVKMIAVPRRVVGVAAETKLGPVVQAVGARWRLADLQAWPEGLAGTRVWAEGMPARVQAPAGGPDAEGNQRQGVAPGSAPENVLRETRWGRAEDADGPWTLVVADGSANVTTVTFDGDGGRWNYRPVTPAESSSGVYSGGEPASGTLGGEAARGLYRALLDVASTAGKAAKGPRAMGEAQLRVDDLNGQRGWVTSRGEVTGRLLAPLEALRKVASPEAPSPR